MAEQELQSMLEPSSLTFDLLEQDEKYRAVYADLSSSLSLSTQRQTIPFSPLDVATSEEELRPAFHLDAHQAVQALFADFGLATAPSTDYARIEATQGTLVEQEGVFDEERLAALRSPASTRALLDAVALLALHPAATVAVAVRFRPLVVDLAARWLIFLGFDGRTFEGGGQPAMALAVFAAVARLAEAFPVLHPHLLILLQHPLVADNPFHLLNAQVQQVQLAHSTSPPPTQSVADPELDHVFSHPDLHTLLLALHRMIHALPTLRDNLPSWSVPPAKLVAIMKRHPYIAFRLLAWRITRQYTGFFAGTGEDLREKWVYSPPADRGHGSLPQDVPFPSSDSSSQEVLPYEMVPTAGQARLSADGRHAVELRSSMVDVWILPVAEEKRIRRMIEAPGVEWAETPVLRSEERCGLVVDTAGVLSLSEATLPSSSLRTSPSPSSAPFVITSTATKALQRLAMLARARLPTLLSSPPAAGKSSLLSYLHRQLAGPLAHSPVTINLADRSLDAKALVGSLASDPADPGSFIFVEGALTRAMRLGRWLILEDVDRANDDVLVVISEVAERMRTAALSIPDGGGGYAVAGIEAAGRFVRAKEGFALFATRSNTALASFFGVQQWCEVGLEAPTVEEAVEIVQARFERVRFAKVLVEVWMALREVEGRTTGKGRAIGFRDLIKWCRRVEGVLPTDLVITEPWDNPVVQDQIVAEASDVFLGALPPSHAAQRQALAEVIATHFRLSPERAGHAFADRIPELQRPVSTSTASTLRIGRVAYPTLPVPPTSTTTLRAFAFTKPALALLEQVAVCAHLAEPALLVGETGTGKTTVVSQLASMLGRSLVSLNLSNQTEASDLLGGYKPLDESVESKRAALALVNVFVDLFGQSFSLARNADFVKAVRTAADKARWPRLVGLFREASRMALGSLRAPRQNGTESPTKRRKTENDAGVVAWAAFGERVTEFEQRHAVKGRGSRPTFAFVEGPLVRALRDGSWMLLDEVNLAASETLEALSTLLSAPEASIVLTERGDIEPVPRHPDFRLFACMNPATDVGKRDLPPALRSCFTELYVPAPDANREALLAIVDGYLGAVSVGDRGTIADVADFYAAAKDLALRAQLADGTNQPPHYSMRTLTRALVFAVDHVGIFGLRRAILEGLLMTFTMLLDDKSASVVHALLEGYVLGGASIARATHQVPARPRDGASYVQLDHYWLERGPMEPSAPVDYVITPSVNSKIASLARVVLSRRLPVLIQGPTSSGKTSIVEYLAKCTGHRFVRINNHEHTDIQEYLGTYISDPVSGKLVFQEGVLVRALRQGDWIVLDELNLAPTDVLEALNRLLDDNRELVIPETQEVVRPHPHFMLFATQNPPGLYAGRKALSRAFRNRFLELHFDDVPEDELKSILSQRCRIAPSYAERIVKVFLELRRRRQASRVFEERQAFATLRDLFRWGGRGAVGLPQLAADGYMLLAERARTDEDKAVVKAVIEEVLRQPIDETALYASVPAASSSLVWTAAMRRLYTLVDAALRHQEPVLLIGETGCGKTSVCQLVADARGSTLYTVNCHQGTDAADLLGGQRPVRDRAALQASIRREIDTMLAEVEMDPLTDELDFEAALAAFEKAKLPSADATDLLARARRALALFDWHDGPLVNAMMESGVFLLDEISLADDSVLERLNSVLEPDRTLVLAEKGGRDIDELRVQANEGFRFVATMNPGGDFGKKELSPALRNRFTEIWVPNVGNEGEMLEIIGGRWRSSEMASLGPSMLDFRRWLGETLRSSVMLTLRTLLAWVDFINASSLPLDKSFVEGALMVAVDGLGSSSSASLGQADMAIQRQACIDKLISLGGADSSSTAHLPAITASVHRFSIGDFGVSRGSNSTSVAAFSFEAPSSRQNAMRILRALQLPKPILLEGSPGVGKTTIVAALAAAAGRRLQRINLSDQSDLVDLFGSDLPVEGGSAGDFAWRNAAFLSAMEAGDWVLLDEMNLAPQPVLEGLNSCLDHRGEVYVPELGRAFTRHPDFRIFAAQNPLHQGGSRKGLPRSFVDRFSLVYMADLTSSDLVILCKELSPQADDGMVRKMVEVVERLSKLTETRPSFGLSGAPWEFNLRDIMRWLALLARPTGFELEPASAFEHAGLLFLQRFRTADDRRHVCDIFATVFGRPLDADHRTSIDITAHAMRVGSSTFSRFDTSFLPSRLPPAASYALEGLATTLAQAWLTILVGAPRTGKSSLVKALASASGRRLHIVSLSPQSDALDLLGGFDQESTARRTYALHEELRKWVEHATRTMLMANSGSGEQLLGALARSLAAEIVEPRTWLALLNELMSSGVAPSQDLLSRLQHKVDLSKPSKRFKWIDGPLLTAMQQGDWLLVENANMCNAAVLDRLNSLFEPNGRIVLNERGQVGGQVPVISPHPDFRLVMALNPKFGELSRAMRNRGVEVSLDDWPTSSSEPTCDLQDPALQHLASLPLFNRPSSPVLTRHAIEALPPRLHGLAARLNSVELGKLFVKEASTQALGRQVDARYQVHAHQRMLPDTLMRAQPLQLSLNPHLLQYGPLAMRDLTAVVVVRAVAALSTLAVRREGGVGQLAATLQHSAIRYGSQAGSEAVRVFVGKLHEAVSGGLVRSLDLEHEQSDQVVSLLNLADLCGELAHLASSPSFDFSSAQQIVKLVESALSALQASELLGMLEQVKQALRVGDAADMTLIWRHFLPIELANKKLDSARRDLFDALRTRWNSVDAELKQLAFEVLCGLHSVNATNDSSAHLAETLALARSLTERVHISKIDALAALSPLVQHAGFIATTLAVLSVFARSLHSRPSSQEVAAFGSIYLGAATCLEILALTFQDTTNAGRQSALSACLEQLVKPNEGSTWQPADAFRPTQVATVLHALTSTIEHIATSRTTLQQMMRVELESAAIQQPLRADSLLRLATAQLHELVALFDPSASANLDFATIVGLACQSSSLALSSAAQRFLPRSSSDLGALLVGVAQTLWSLYVTDVPIDPAVGQQAHRAFLLRVEQRQLEDAVLHAVRDLELRGGRAGPRARSLLASLERVRAQVKELGPALVDRHPDPTAVSALFSDLATCSASVFDHERLSSLLTSLRDGQGGQEAERARTICQSAAAARQRVQALYMDRYADLLQPALTALALLSVGIDIARQEAAVRASKATAQIWSTAVSGLSTFPTVASGQAAMSLRLPVSLKSTQTSILPPSYPPMLNILGLLRHRVAFSEGNLATLASSFDQLYQMWAVDRRRAEDAVTDAAREYRQRGGTHRDGGTNDEEDDERDFRELFPEAMGDVEDETASSTKTAQLLPTEQLLILQRSHAFLLDHSLEGIDADFDQLARSSIGMATDKLYDILHERIDGISTAHRLELVRNGHGHLSEAADTTDFYRSSNVGQASKLLPIMHDLIKRLNELIVDWPEQQILHHLVERCRAILALPATAQLPRALAHLENMLMPMDDWQGLASREVSLETHRTRIIELIVEWRRLELASWPPLLDHEARRFVEEVAGWWPRFYETAVRGPQAFAEGGSTEADAYLRELVSLLDSFFAAGPAGQFDARLRLLRSFAKHVASLCTTSSSITLQHVARILHNIGNFYARFLPAVSTFIAAERAKVERQIRDIVKLASWKDVNVHALRQSAQRSHRSLHKCIKTWRAVLQRRASDFFGDLAPSATIEPLRLINVEEAITAAALATPAAVDAPEHLRHLPRTITRFEQICRPLTGHAAAELDNFSSTIASTAEELQKEAIPKEDEATRNRLFKALLTRKRRAWADLLKELKRIGLAHNPSAALTSRVRDSSIVYREGSKAHFDAAERTGSSCFPDAPMNEESADAPADELDDVDAYFFRVIALLPRLRDAPATHHDDIAPRDLQRALGSVESCVSLALDHRRHLVKSLIDVTDLHRSLIRHGAALQEGDVAAQSAAHSAIDALRAVSHLRDAVEEVLQRSQADAALAGTEAPSPSVLADLASIRDRAQVDADALAVIHHTSNGNSDSLALQSEVDAVEKAKATFERALGELRALVGEAPRLRYLLEPTVAFLSSEAPASKVAIEPTSSATEAHQHLISSLLVVAQSFTHVEPIADADQASLSDGALPTAASTLLERQRQLRLPEILTSLRTLTSSLPHDPSSRTILGRTYPFLQRYFTTAQAHLTAHAAWIRSLFKLAYVVSSISLTLAEKGYCKPIDADKAPGEATADGDDGEPADGTGMGSGKGGKDVSKEIEGEEQLEGLQGEEEDEMDEVEGDGQKSGEKGEEEEDGFDMENDFAGGKTSDAGSQADADEDEDREGDEDEAEADEQVGDVDPLDASAVDEKFWAGEEDEKTKPANEEAADQGQETGESKPEMTAGKEDKQKREGGSTEEMNADAAEGEEEEGGEDDAPPAKEKKPDEVALPEGENLEMPEGLEVDDEEKREEGGMEGDDDPLDLDDLDLPDDGKGDDIGQPDLGDAESQEGDEQQTDHDARGPAELDEEQAGAPEDELAPTAGDSQGEAAPDQGDAGGQGASAAEQGAAEAQDAQQAVGGADAGEQPAQADDRMQEEATDAAHDPSANADAPSGSNGAFAPVSSVGGAGRADEQAPPPDPSRSLGDANEAWRRRLDAISAANDEERDARAAEDSNETAEQVEYVRDEQAHESQALGPASEEQSRDTERMVEGDDQAEPERPVEKDEGMDMPVDQPRAPLNVDVGRQLPNTDLSAFSSTSQRDSRPSEAMDVDVPEDTGTVEVEDEQGPELEGQGSAQVEQELVRWQMGDEAALEPGAVWQLYTTLTRSACFRLTEQLRLILEPTQATRLRGDYRSGKRLNMKRLIPYIASDFTKDKIWLRRTRPSAREYQILLALDDSKSMADSHSVHLAYQALALVSGALGRLEAGEVSVTRFGAEVDVVHPFGGGALLDEASGAEIIRRFTFGQRKTDLVRLLEASLAQLSEARAAKRGGSTELWQMMLIISDGLCQDQDQLRALLRKAYANRVMVVFVVVDSLHQRSSSTAGDSSILSMKSVSYAQTADGKLEMRVDRYMDTFPFEYYIVLRDADALPDVLSQTLRQFFERVSGTS